MNLKKKITVAVLIEHAEKIIFLMDKINFTEIDRVATGGMMSSPELLITFEGNISAYHEKGYITRAGDLTGFKYYHSIKQPNGNHTNDFELFKESEKSKKDNFDYNVL